MAYIIASCLLGIFSCAKNTRLLNYYLELLDDDPPLLLDSLAIPAEKFRVFVKQGAEAWPWDTAVEEEILKAGGDFNRPLAGDWSANDCAGRGWVGSDEAGMVSAETEEEVREFFETVDDEDEIVPVDADAIWIRNFQVQKNYWVLSNPVIETNLLLHFSHIENIVK